MATGQVAAWAPGPAARAWQLLSAYVEADSACPTTQQSLRWMWTELEYGGGYFGDAPDGGYRRLVTAMAAGSMSGSASPCPRWWCGKTVSGW